MRRAGGAWSSSSGYRTPGCAAGTDCAGVGARDGACLGIGCCVPAWIGARVGVGCTPSGPSCSASLSLALVVVGVVVVVGRRWLVVGVVVVVVVAVPGRAVGWFCTAGLPAAWVLATREVGLGVAWAGGCGVGLGAGTTQPSAVGRQPAGRGAPGARNCGSPPGTMPSCPARPDKVPGSASTEACSDSDCSWRLRSAARVCRSCSRKASCADAVLSSNSPTSPAPKRPSTMPRNQARDARTRCPEATGVAAVPAVLPGRVRP